VWLIVTVRLFRPALARITRARDLPSSEREVPMGELESTRAKRGRVPRSARMRRIGYAGIILAALCACDVGRSGPEPIAECATYAASAELCLGARISKRLRASFAKPPADEAGRAALRTQCVERNAMLRQSCR
jgi:hypothetical protein